MNNQPLDANLRKSKRQPVPNRIYQQGITDLINQNTTRIKRKAKNQHEGDLSYQDQKYSNLMQDQSQYESKDIYYQCKMTNGVQMRVKFVFDCGKEGGKQWKQTKQWKQSKQSKQGKDVQNIKEGRQSREYKQTRDFREPKKQDKYKQTNPPQQRIISQHISAPIKKSNTNLLNLFFQAIDKVQQQQPYPETFQPLPKPQSYPLYQKQKPILQTRPKRIRPDTQQCIKKVTIQNKTMKIYHSQLKTLEYDVDWTDTTMKNQNNEQIDQIRKKLENCKIMKNIPIFMSV